MSDFNRFMSKVSVADTHWIWTAATDKRGYGRFAVNGQNLLAHHYAYALKYPKDTIDLLRNKCGVHNCVNPEHWENKKGRSTKTTAQVEQILRLTAEGLTSEQVARQVGCSVELVRLRLREQR